MVNLFQTDERVLCFSGPLLYEAKILASKKEGNSTTYSVHYKGWKTRYDEWITEDRVLKYNDENLKMRESLFSKHNRKRSKTPNMPNKSLESDAKANHSTKRSKDSEREEEYLSKPQVRLTIPDSLKVRLVDDWEFVTKSQKLVPLPRTPNVSEIISNYKKSKQVKRGRSADAENVGNEDLLDEVICGLKLYFDKALGNILLYGFERKQLKDIMEQREKSAQSVLPSDVYGAEHLLRLFVQLPQLIAFTNLDEPAVNILLFYLHDFLKYMQKMSSELFTDYVDASSQYVADQRT